MIFEDRSDKFFIMDNRYVDIWLRTLGPGPFSLLCLFKRMCKGETENVFPRMKREDWAEYMGISLQTLNSYVLILKKHNLIQIKTPKGSDRLQHKPSKYIIPRISESILKEKDYPKPLSKSCRFGDIIHNPGTPFFIKTISTDNINFITSGCENVSTSGQDRKYDVQLIRTIDKKTIDKKTVKDITPNNSKDLSGDVYKRLSEKLKDIVSFANKITLGTRTHQWPDHFRKLNKIDKIPISRIKEVLRWYEKHIGDDYVHECFSADSFRKKFNGLESDMARMERESKPKKPRTRPGGAEMEEGKYDNTPGKLFDNVTGKWYRTVGEKVMEEIK